MHKLKLPITSWDIAVERACEVYEDSWVMLDNVFKTKQPVLNRLILDYVSGYIFDLSIEVFLLKVAKAMCDSHDT